MLNIHMRAFMLFSFRPHPNLDAVSVDIFFLFCFAFYDLFLTAALLFLYFLLFLYQLLNCMPSKCKQVAVTLYSRIVVTFKNNVHDFVCYCSSILKSCVRFCCTVDCRWNFFKRFNLNEKRINAKRSIFFNNNKNTRITFNTFVFICCFCSHFQLVASFKSYQTNRLTANSIEINTKGRLSCFTT